MDAILSMPVPMSTALMVLMAIAAFFFIKLVALVFTPSYNDRYVLVESREVNHDDRRAVPAPGRRASDRRSAGNVVAG
jgi:hypothetical protein